MSVSPATLPPVLLHPEAELARAALATPLLSRAVRLARWAGPETRVGAGGELVDAQLPAAAAELGLAADDPDAAAYASEAWRVAVDTGLVEVTDAEEEGGEGTVTQGEDLALLSEGGPQDVLGIWLGALDTVYADATVPDMEDLLDVLEENGEVDFADLGWDPQAEADFLDGVLGNLYLLTVGDAAAGEGPVPLPALAASMIVPDDMAEPTDDILEQVSDAMMKLDDQFRLFEPLGLVEYRPVDEALMADVDDDGAEEPAPVDDEDVSRYGMVRLTPLGLYGVRARMLEAGVDAPAVGDLADKGADALLDGTSGFPQAAAQAEIEQWLAHHEPLGAARELLAAARGGDEGAPLRRLRCQQALSLVGDEAEPALRDVLDDPELGGLARVWLAEHGAADVPAPSEALVFWLTIDTIAAQLAAEGNSDELQGLVEGLAQQHSGFFATAWRVEHPATADVLEAMGRLHPDKKVAKEARKAAFKARSQQGL
ncbi:hypothetical protein [Streptomyces luteocolor]|uniref:hypothetical protein n=1 Tax=Streptomyces luteocolor TaxID=285500 RepID=UPI000853080B|nr:hypothetical protein [Streptomyces luteocolor]